MQSQNIFKRTASDIIYHVSNATKGLHSLIQIYNTFLQLFLTCLLLSNRIFEQVQASSRFNTNLKNFFTFYSGDLNNEHLNNGNIWITNFYLSGIQMVVRYSNHHSNTVWYSNGVPNTGQNLVQYSNGIWITDHSVIGQLLTIWIPD